MSVEQPFAMHRQQAWEERTGDPRLPRWMRVTALAYAKHRANGHANLRAGDLAWMLGTVDKSTGELRKWTNVSREIRTAVALGFLGADSRSTCLIVPAHTVTGGLGNPHAKCPVHSKVSRSAKQSSKELLHSAKQSTALSEAVGG